MKVTFKGITKNDANIYLLQGSKDELEAYKKAKGTYHMVDEKTKQPLYFTKRALSSQIDYELDGAALVAPNAEETRAKTQTMLDTLAKVGNFSVSKSQLRSLEAARLLAQLNAEE
jgi:hypothetical protein